MTADSDYLCGYVALIGRPNVGKSTLLNQLIGQKIAITAHKPQTTRHALLGIKTTDNSQILYVDTPGIHQRDRRALNRILNKTALAVLIDVDVIIFVIEAARWTKEDAKVFDAIKKISKPVILAINKVDRLQNKNDLLAEIKEHATKLDFAAVVAISATKNIQINLLEDALREHLPKQPAYYPDEQVTDKTESFLAAELLREQLTRRYHQELPYALSVEIKQFEEKVKLYRIHAVIWVERQSQKAIIIGNNGQALKQTNKQARQSMERLFDKKVWLEVQVKVKKNWSSNEKALTSLGYVNESL